MTTIIQRRMGQWNETKEDGGDKVQKAIVFSFMVVLNTYSMAIVTRKFGALCRVLVGGWYNVEGVYSDSVRCGGLCDVKWATLVW